jgi:hypothetical protein
MNEGKRTSYTERLQRLVAGHVEGMKAMFKPGSNPRVTVLIRTDDEQAVFGYTTDELGDVERVIGQWKRGEL